MTVSITSESLMHLRDEGNYYIGVPPIQGERDCWSKSSLVGRQLFTFYVSTDDTRCYPPLPPSSCLPQCVSVSLSLDLWTIGGEVE